MKKQRQWLILEEPKEVYKKALKNYSNWKLNYIKFLKKIIALNPYIGFDLDKKNNVWISLRHLEGRYLSNPKYKKEGFLKPINVPLQKNILNKLPNKHKINKKDGSFYLTVVDTDTEIDIIEEYLFEYIKKYPHAYIYKLNPDIIGFLHKIITDGFKQGTVIYKSNKSKQWQQ